MTQSGQQTVGTGLTAHRPVKLDTKYGYRHIRHKLYAGICKPSYWLNMSNCAFRHLRLELITRVRPRVIFVFYTVMNGSGHQGLIH